MAVVTDTVIFYVRVDREMMKNVKDIEDRFEKIRREMFMMENNDDDDDFNKKTIDLSVEGCPALAMIVYHLKNGSHATIKLYNDGLINVEVQFTELKNLTLSATSKYHARLLEQFGANVVKESNILCSGIRRGTEFWNYSVLDDHRIVETDWNGIVCEVQTPFNNIKVVSSRNNGNVIMLDEDVMLAESDLTFPRVLCGIGDNLAKHKEDYVDKEVLILGGGIGGNLHEVLKEKPKFVTVVELDAEVLNACRQHLRGICFDALDELKGPNHEIIVGDGFKVLQDFINKGKKVDILIDDINLEQAEENFAFDPVLSERMFDLALQVLKKPTGKFLMGGSGITNLNYHDNLQALITARGLDYRTHKVYPPSFMGECYVTYEAFYTEMKD